MWVTDNGAPAQCSAGHNMPDFCGLLSCGVDVGESGRCSRCKAIMYCGAAHQREDWRRHREACRGIEAARREETQMEREVREGMTGSMESTPPISSEDLKMLRERVGDRLLQETVEMLLEQGLASDRQEALKGAECGRRGTHPQRCTGCFLTIYCSKECQKAAWPGHGAACKAVMPLWKRDP